MSILSIKSIVSTPFAPQLHPNRKGDSDFTKESDLIETVLLMDKVPDFESERIAVYCAYEVKICPLCPYLGGKSVYFVHLVH